VQAALRVRLLPVLTDVDTAEDAVAVAADCGGSRFALAVQATALTGGPRADAGP
jgi:hypothetical protein